MQNASTTDRLCNWHLCRDPAIPNFTAPICSAHLDLILIGIDRNAKSRPKPPPSPATNRHGIPLHGGTRPRCCWPKCPSPVGTYPGLPLCNSHACLTADVYTKVHADLIAAREARFASAAEVERAEKRTLPGTIYYVRSGGHIKIGWTSDLQGRMKGYPPNSELLATEPGTREQELRLHKRFAAHRSHGREWYPLVPVLLDHIDRVVREHGKPEDITFGAQPVKVPEPRPKQYLRPKGWSGKINAGWK